MLALYRAGRQADALATSARAPSPRRGITSSATGAERSRSPSVRCSFRIRRSSLPRATPVTVALKAPFPAALEPRFAASRRTRVRARLAPLGVAACRRRQRQRAPRHAGQAVRRAFAARSRASPTRTVSSPTGLLPAPPTSISTRSSSPTKWSRNRRLSSSTTSANASSSAFEALRRLRTSGTAAASRRRRRPTRPGPLPAGTGAGPVRGGGRRAPTARPARPCGRTGDRQPGTRAGPASRTWSTRSSPRGGVPRLVHENSQPERRPTRDVNSIGAVSVAAHRRSALSATRAEVASGVAGLQRAREHPTDQRGFGNREEPPSSALQGAATPSKPTTPTTSSDARNSSPTSWRGSSAPTSSASRGLPSGCKSSLLRAGLLGTLAAGVIPGASGGGRR